jgi:diguanylate cyclase (GGDEF)-like protein
VTGELELDGPERPTGLAHRRSRWLRSVVVVTILLAAIGWLNISLNDASARSTVAASLLLRLDSTLQEEGTLQWRALAERGTPTRVAADVGTVRAAERELLDGLSGRLSASDLVGLEQQIEAYHVALDQELSLLAVGRTDDAVAFERQVTTPGFQALSRWLQSRAETESADAARLARRAHVLLATTLAALSLVIGLLVWSAERAHRASAATARQLLENERATVEQLRISQAAIRHQAEHDPLTDLPNRLLFNQRLAEATASSPTAVLFVDLDGFKAINDGWGHAIGDRLLVEVGHRLRDCTRAEDVVARLGGDEFAVLLIDSDAESAGVVADRVEAVLRAPVSVRGGEVSVGASIGIAAGDVGVDPELLLTDADHRMYEQKRADRQPVDLGRRDDLGRPLAAAELADAARPGNL